MNSSQQKLPRKLSRFYHLFLVFDLPTWGGMSLERKLRGPNSRDIWHRYEYNLIECSGPRGHISIFKSLMEHLCGASRSKLLREDLKISSVFEEGQLDCNVFSCRCCVDMVSSFPFELILKSLGGEGATCVPRVDTLGLLLARPESDCALRSDVGIESLIKCFGHVLPLTTVFGNSSVDDAFMKKLETCGAKPYRGTMLVFRDIRVDESDNDFRNFIKLIDDSRTLKGIIRDIPRSKILQTWPFKPVVPIRGRTIYTRQLFDALLKAGLNLRSEDYILVDQKRKNQRFSLAGIF